MTEVKRNPAELIESVDTAVIQVRTKNLDISFNELYDMFQSGELLIQPEFQRLFRWSEARQSQFIESLILELPIPPIYVIELESGVYELIDGLQRISSYLHFRGLKTEISTVNGKTSTSNKKEFLSLSSCDVMKELNSLTYNDLPQALQIKLKRNFIRMEVIRKESDKRLKYYMFKRLNTGGETLSEQEIRNCTIRLLGHRFNDFLQELAKSTDFSNCLSTLSDEKKQQMYMEEYVLRFFAIKNYRKRYEKVLHEFLTEYMEKVSDLEADNPITFEYEEERRIFGKTFEILNKISGETIFSGVNKTGNTQGYFSALHYEAISIGIQPYLEQLHSLNATELNKIQKGFSELKRDSKFQSNTKGGGKNYAAALKKRIEFVEDWVKKCLQQISQ
jgi:hypothetical protein